MLLYTLLYFIERQKKRRSKYLVLGPGAQRTFRLSSRTPRIPFNVLLSRVHVLDSVILNENYLYMSFQVVPTYLKITFVSKRLNLNFEQLYEFSKFSEFTCNKS